VTSQATQSEITNNNNNSDSKDNNSNAIQPTITSFYTTVKLSPTTQQSTADPVQKPTSWSSRRRRNPGEDIDSPTTTASDNGK